ncbi:MAG: tetratricopeptide repeat protein, partial [Planctomycetota bacterium]
NDLPIGEEAIVHSTVVEGLERAIALDPGFADAHAGLAAMLLLKTWLGESDPAERAQARAALAQAERLAPKRLEVLKARALLLYQDREYDEAMAALAEILERDPGDVNSLSTIAALLRRTGDLDGALSAYERCTRINPLDAGNVHEHSLTLTMVGRFEEAEERALKVLELAPSFREAQVALRHNRIVQRIPRADVDRELAALRAEYAAGGDVWELALQCGDAAAALAALDGIPDVRTTQTRVLVASTLRGQCLAALGRPDEARAEFARSVERIESEGAEGWIWDAARSLAYAGVGDRDASLAAADAALAAMPYERDAIVWHDLAMDVASAYVLLGEPDRALELALLEENLTVALAARGAFPWARAVPEELFLNDVLPYAVLDETRERWRADMFARTVPLVLEAATLEEAAQRINERLFDVVDVHYNTG